MSKININMLPGFRKSLLPVQGEKTKPWWQDNDKTKNHIQKCLPLGMANSLGYQILSPATFTVEWDGDVHANAIVTVLEQCENCAVDDHAAYGSFTVQPGFIPTTDNVGDFIMIKGLPNERCQPYSCMEAVIEAWWSRARFGLVFLMNQKGKILVSMGQPIAQMFVIKSDGFHDELNVVDSLTDDFISWHDKRSRPGYNIDLDYMRGLLPGGQQAEDHLVAWRKK